MGPKREVFPGEEGEWTERTRRGMHEGEEGGPRGREHIHREGGDPDCWGLKGRCCPGTGVNGEGKDRRAGRSEGDDDESVQKIGCRGAVQSG